MLTLYLDKLIRKQNLSAQETEAVMYTIIRNDFLPTQIAALLVLLRQKKESLEEVYGFLKAAQSTLSIPEISYRTLDIVGTGGDRSFSVNISTGASIVAASCGVKIMKHGNRKNSSLCGAADLLEYWGINLTPDLDQLTKSLEECNLSFCFAPHFYPFFKNLHNVRQELNIPTVFNLLGPLLNPFKPTYTLLGISSLDYLELYIEFFRILKKEHTVIVYSEGLDEISIMGTTKVVEIYQDQIVHYEIDPAMFGLKSYSVDLLRGNQAKDNAYLLEQAFAGRHPAIATALSMNAGMAIYLYGITRDLATGIQMAEQALLSGNALNLLKKWQAFHRNS